jgi:hypothetical protein
MSDKKNKIHYISKTYQGKVHDFTILKTEFPQNQNWFAKFRIWLDLSFQGIADLYQFLELTIPHKKKCVRKGESNKLSKEQIEYNKEAGKERIYVEHSIGGMKRYKILVHRCTLKSENTRNLIVGVCAALWNFTIT